MKGEGDSLSDRFEMWAIGRKDITTAEKIGGVFFYLCCPIIGWIYLLVLFTVARMVEKYAKG